MPRRQTSVEVASQGATIEEALEALREALELYFEDEDEAIALAHPLVTHRRSCDARLV
ncbi:MAG: type II toxin-antitoxin system HicB family antitoxin [Acidimicrobiales bacterium]